MKEKQVTVTWYMPEEKLPPEGVAVVITFSGKDGSRGYDHALGTATWFDDGCGWMADGLSGDAEFLVHAWCDLEPSHDKRWRAKRGDDYCCMNNFGTIVWKEEDNDRADNWRFETGNYFRTVEEAEFYKQSLIVHSKLKEYAVPDEEQVWDGSRKNWYISYHYDQGRIDYFVNGSFKDSVLYFASREDAERAVAAAGEENVKKYYLKVKE